MQRIKVTGIFLKPLPKLVQRSPVNGIVVADINFDGNLDAFMIGNDYGNEVFSGKYDAGTGTVLLGDGKGNFTACIFCEKWLQSRLEMPKLWRS